LISSSSNGKYPASSANNITPDDHVSTSVPQYYLPEITSGAA
jgi:hypothetical protein